MGLADICGCRRLVDHQAAPPSRTLSLILCIGWLGDFGTPKHFNVKNFEVFEHQGDWITEAYEKRR